jgi:hypothetical protein
VCRHDASFASGFASTREHPDLVVGDVSSERAAEVLAKLEEQGMIVGT